MRHLLLLACCACTSLPPAPTPTVATARDSDLRPHFTALGLPPRAQGARPTCSIFTTVAAFEFAAGRARGHGERLSVDYCNWAANAATGRGDDGDFFVHALQGFATYGLCRDELWPYGATFQPNAQPTPAALVDGGRQLGALGPRLQVRWLKPNDGVRGLDAAQFAAIVDLLARGWPVAAGAAHSRLLVGFRPAPGTTDEGEFLTLDSGLGDFGTVPARYVRDELCDAFAVVVSDVKDAESHIDDAASKSHR